MLSSAIQRITSPLRDPRVRELVLWCLPALIVGLVLRAILTAQMPFAYYHDDAPDFFVTPDELLEKGRWSIHGKKTWLVPVLFSLPVLAGGPALVIIPLAQHALGLGMVLMIGALARLWLHCWKAVIIPLTVLAAINPYLLWYEHTIMAETVLLACTVGLALAATLYVRNPTRGRFAGLCVALVLEAGARPEGKLLFGFGLLLLAAVHFREWRGYWPRLAIVLVLAAGSHLITRTSQAGLLLYTSVLRIAPERLEVAPGLEAYIDPLRLDLRQRWAARPNFPRVRDRRVVSSSVEQYLEANVARFGKVEDASTNAFSLRLAMEICRRQWRELPELVGHKFRFVASESPAGEFTNEFLFGKQMEAFLDNPARTIRLSRRLTGRSLDSPDALRGFITQHYREIPWFNNWSAAWLRTASAWRLPDQQFATGKRPFIYAGVPALFVLAACGVLVAMLLPGRLRVFHIAWGLTLFGLFFIIMLTANVRPRFRLFFEPFWLGYVAMLVECLWLAATRFLPRRP